jgi:peptidoglycan hydrolase CwlO-like protein|tara:strand:+ start:443 stop:703 length:261 start_codon:yes stop_codon:yes gene_type:complete
MNKYEIKYQLEQMTSSVDRLTDVAGKQCLHIENLWEEIGAKNNRIADLNQKIIERNEKIRELQNIIKSQTQKNLAEYHFGEESVNN